MIRSQLNLGVLQQHTSPEGRLDKASCARAIDILELYNAKATELNSSSFVAHMRMGGTSTFTFASAPFRVVRSGGPTSETVKAFLLTFRLFLLQRDQLSFAKIRALYGTLPVRGETTARVVAICDEVERYLNGPSVFDFHGEKPTRRVFLETWLYGEIAHLNAEKRAKLKVWGIEPDVQPFIDHEFEGVVVALLQAVFWIRQENLVALAGLRTLV